MNYKILFIAGLLSFLTHSTYAQVDESVIRSSQMSTPRVSNAFNKFDNKLKAEFRSKGFNYPADNVYIRSFKAQNELELWVKNKDADTFSLFKTYKVCALSGMLGPKRVEGDRQVPEGLYFLTTYNPNSDFHLSMLVNYPNYSDMILGNKAKLGGDIYIHGGCLTVGCLPMTDEGIQEIYTICLGARMNGDNNIPVQIFPTIFNKAGLNFLGKEYKVDTEKQKFWINLKAAYDYFEVNKNPAPVMYNEEGKYIF